MGENDSDKSNYDLKLKEVDQLHSVTIEFSKTCLEIKKLFVGIIISLSAIILKLNGDAVNNNLFFLLTITTVLFWIIDAQAYYYQSKIRSRMAELMNEARVIKGLILTDGVGMPIRGGNTLIRVRKAFFNYSQTLYIIVIIINIIGYVIVTKGKPCLIAHFLA